MATPNSQAIQIANQIMGLAALQVQIINQMIALNTQWTADGAAATLSAMATAPLSSDGNQNITNDTTPNAAHPISLLTYPSLNRAVTETQIAQILTTMNQITSWYQGNAVSANAGAAAILNVAVGG